VASVSHRPAPVPLVVGIGALVAQCSCPSRVTVMQQEPGDAPKQGHAGRVRAVVAVRCDLDRGLRQHSCWERPAVLLVHDNGDERLGFASEDLAARIDDLLSERFEQPGIDCDAGVDGRGSERLEDVRRSFEVIASTSNSESSGAVSRATRRSRSSTLSMFRPLEGWDQAPRLLSAARGALVRAIGWSGARVHPLLLVRRGRNTGLAVG
jgi:hypothetical protein